MTVAPLLKEGRMFIKSDYSGDVKLGKDLLKYYTSWQIVSYKGKDGKTVDLPDSEEDLNDLLKEQDVEVKMIPDPRGYRFN